MPFSLTQLVLSVFLIFAATRVILRFKGGTLSPAEFLFWSGIFIVGLVAVVFPGLTTDFARTIGVGRGVDAVVYLSIALLFYLVFRIYIYLEDQKREMTDLIRKLALKEYEKKSKKSATKN